MSQNDFSLANQSGANFRADNNSALQALASLSSGATAPSTTYAYQLWADTTDNVLKRRNAANSGWIVLSTLAEAFVVARNSNTIIAATDVGKTFVFSSTFTQTLTAAATLGDGFYFNFKNNGSGVITLDPNSSETIDGATTLAIQPGQCGRVYCNGSAFYVEMRPLYNATASGTDTYTASVAPVPTGYATGEQYFITFTNANTSTTPTLNLNSLGAKTIVTAAGGALTAGDIPAGHLALLVYDGTNMRLLNPSNTPTGYQVGYTDTSTDVVTNCSGTIPYDDTTPQNTEGTELLTVSYTPRYASSKILIEFEAWGVTSASTGVHAIVAFFQDSTASAFAAAAHGQDQTTTGAPTRIHLKAVINATNTSARTYKVRVGSPTGTNFYINGDGSGNRKFGSASLAFLRIYEIKQ